MLRLCSHKWRRHERQHRDAEQHGPKGATAIHAGQEPDPTTGAIMTPVYFTSTYVQDGPGEHKGYEYSRTKNPTRAALEACLAALEGAKYGAAFAAGCAAADMLMHLLDSGAHVVVSDDVYGGTFRLFDKVFRRQGFTFSFVDMTDPANVEKAITPRTRMVWIETPTNPMLKLADLSAVAAIAQEGRRSASSTTPSRRRTSSARSSSAPTSSCTRRRST